MEEYKDKCCLCRYCRWIEEKKSMVCVNEDSNTWGRLIQKPREEKCHNQKRNRYGNDKIELKAALKTVTTKSMGMWEYYVLPDSDVRHPFLAVDFKTNEEMENWREAFTRLFGEYMALAKKDGDFKE